ncbi:MAG TPA: hypothetical protein VMV72_16640 [Verrucomicrobiae bacterium]|nr:hypothetical protein [Verrucomicrobiae bacterium]
MIAIFIFVAPLIIAGAIALVGLITKALCPRARFCWTLTGLHSVATGFALLPSAFGKGFPDIPFDDVYLPFLLYPGWPFSALCARFVSDPLKDRLFEFYSCQRASLIALVWIPGILALLAGSIVWFVLGRILDRHIQ